MKRTTLAALFLCAVPIAVTTSCEVSQVATPEEQAAQASLDEQIAAVQVRIDAGETGLDAELAQLVAARDAGARSIAERVVGSVVKFIDPFIPAPLQPFVPLLGGLFFKRPRKVIKGQFKKVWNATKNVSKGEVGAAATDVGDALEDVLKLVGLRHSNKDPMAVMRGAAQAARDAGNASLAIAIEAKIEELKLLQATTPPAVPPTG